VTRIAVIGGGITGLAAAYEAGKGGADVTLYEASDRLGGKVRTSDFAGGPVDEAADAFLARVPWGVELCEELGVADLLVSPERGNAYVFADGELRALPEGLVLGVPTDLDALRGSGIVSEDAVRRAAADLDRTSDDSPPDESVGALIRRRLGDEVLERLVDPLLGGINAGDADRLSLAAAAPQIAAAASTDPSLIKALRAQRAEAASDPSAPVFHALPGGMAALVDAITSQLQAEVCLGTSIDDLDDVDADAVIITAPSRAAAGLVEQRAPEAARLLRTIDHAGVTLLSIAIAEDDLRRPLDASGFLVPRTEGLLITACSWASAKWAHLVRPEIALLRASAGRLGDERALDLDDDALVEAVLADLDRTMGLGGGPLDVRISRWPDAFPQYRPGHLALVAAIEDDLRAAAPTWQVTGAAHRGLGIPACIRQGREAARAAVAFGTGANWERGAHG
jgi:oxygen-dependent protoporphyrinogen oxidase